MTEPVTIEQRKQLGAEKKLWSVEILYSEGKNQRKFAKVNLTNDELWNMRKEVFIRGVMVPGGSPTHWKVVNPIFIDSFDCYLQNKYLD